MTSQRAYPMAAETSSAIRIARTICILFMMTVHVWPGAGQILAATPPAPLGVFYDVVIGYLGRGAVPLLSVVSGYLFILGLARRRPGAFGIVLHRKFHSLIRPMILWSAAVLVMQAVSQCVLSGPQVLPETPMQWLNALFALNAQPANAPLGFLRDVFVCVVVGLLAYPVFLRNRWVALGLLVAVNIADFAAGGVLLLRPAIMTFYFLGAVLAVSGGTSRVPGWAVTLAILACDALLRALFGPAPSETVFIFLNLIHRLAMALLMWNLSLLILKAPRVILQGLLKIEPAIFVIFCSHMLTITVVGQILKIIGVGPENPVFLLVLVVQIAAAVAVGMALWRVSERWAPRLFFDLVRERIG